MKLISCHVDNFGTLHDFNMQFEEGLQVILQDNGWGKSTLAAFLKAMLYGYDNRRRKDLTENDRLRYKPWQGGIYGGSLTFEKGGKRYMVTRTFGDTARYDTVRLRDLDAGRSVPGVENVGEWLFKLDAEAFKRSAFISSNQLNNGASSLSFHARLNAVLGEASDVGAFDAAMKQLETRAKDYEKTGNRGYIGELQKKQDALLEQQRMARERIACVESMRQRISTLGEQLAQADAGIAALQKRLDDQDGSRREREAAQSAYKPLLEQRDGLKAQLAALQQEAGGQLPSTHELRTAEQCRNEIARTTEALSALRAQQEKTRGEVQAAYDALLEKENALDAEQEVLLKSGPIPCVEELQELRQGRPELRRLREAIGSLVSEEEKKRGEIQTAYDALCAQQDALARELETATAGLGEYIPTNAQLQDTRRRLADIAQLAVDLRALEEEKARLEGEIQAIAQCYAGPLPGMSELSELLRTQKALEEAHRQVLDSASDREELTRARAERSDTEAALGGEWPEADRLQQARIDLTAAASENSTAMGLEAQAAGEQAKCSGIESAIRQLDAADALSEPAGAAPKSTAAIIALVGAALLAALGAVISPLLFAGAGLLAVLGVVLLVLAGKKKTAYEQAQQLYAAQQKKAREERASLEQELSQAQQSHVAKAKAAAAARERAANLSDSAVSYVRCWNPSADSDNADRITAELQERLAALQRAQRVIDSTAARIDRLSRAEEELRTQLAEKLRCLPEASANLPLEDRVSAAEADAERVRQLQAELKAVSVQLETQAQRQKELVEQTDGFLAKCGLSQEGGEQALTALEQRITAAAAAKQALVSQQKRVADFETANRSALQPDDIETSGAAGPLKKQAEALEQRMAAILTKYAVDEAAVETWLAQSAQRLAGQEALAQRRQALADQIKVFEDTNRDVLTGKESGDETSAQGKLAAQLAALQTTLRVLREKYQVPESSVENWLSRVKELAEAQEKLNVQLAAAQSQISEYEAAHQALLAPESEAADGAIAALRQQLAERTQQREALLKERTQVEDTISHADETLDSYRSIVSHLRLLAEEKQRAQSSLYVLKKSAAYLRAAKENLASRYMGQITHNFNQYFAAWVKSENIRGLVDGDFNITMEDSGGTRDAAGYSTGYCDVIDFCMRMALIDTLFEDERPFIIMDDPFVNLDADRLQHAMRLLKAISAESQVIYFVCHQVRATEPTEPALPELERKRLIKAAAPKVQPRAAAKKARFTLVDAPAVRPLSAKRRITNSIFTLAFAADEGNRGSGEYELFFVDEKEKVLCDRQQLSLLAGEVVPTRLQFCLNTGNAVGTSYSLCVRRVGDPENEIVQKIPYEAAITFATDFDF